MNKDQEMTTLGGCLIRIFWFLLGPLFLFLCATIIVAQRLSFPSALDIAYGIIFILTITARIVDQIQQRVSSSSSSAIGQQVKEQYRPELRSIFRYCIFFTLAGIGLWVITHFVLKGIL
jgi:hypothetical protein